jgi:hypothetical protein
LRDGYVTFQKRTKKRFTGSRITATYIHVLPTRQHRTP